MLPTRPDAAIHLSGKEAACRVVRTASAAQGLHHACACRPVWILGSGYVRLVVCVFEVHQPVDPADEHFLGPRVNCDVVAVIVRVECEIDRGVPNEGEEARPRLRELRR